MKKVLGEKLYTRQEVADMLGVSRSSVVNSTISGRIAGTKLGRYVYISETALKEYLHGQTFVQEKKKSRHADQ